MRIYVLRISWNGAMGARAIKPFIESNNCQSFYHSAVTYVSNMMTLTHRRVYFQR